MMNEALILAENLPVGALLGGVFFGGLWWTVHRAVSSKSIARWLLGSLLLRMGITLAGFYFVSRGHWLRLVVCLLGFLVARALVMRLTRTPVERHPGLPKEAGHAP
jgi:F1F0 ATPase subunit 2